MPKQLTEAQAWRVIAQTIEKRGSMEDGLCHEVTLLALAGRISDDTERKMRNRIPSYVAESGGICYIRSGDGDITWADSQTWCDVRILIALLIAEQCDDEACAA